MGENKRVQDVTHEEIEKLWYLMVGKYTNQDATFEDPYIENFDHEKALDYIVRSFGYAKLWRVLESDTFKEGGDIAL